MQLKVALELQPKQTSSSDTKEIHGNLRGNWRTHSLSRYQYLDLCFGSLSKTELFHAIDRGELKAVTSELTLAEVLVKPMLDQNSQRQEVYKQTLQSSDFLTICPIDRGILIQAAAIRASCQLKLPDAIHVATSIETGCNVFLTNDQHLQRISNPAVLLLSDI